MSTINLISGGVDSSVSLYLTQKMGLHPIAYYIKIWMEDDFIACPWKEDVDFADKVTKKLQIPFEIVSLQKEYWDTIIDYTLKEAKKGLTPNPDVFCNSVIKFGLFAQKYAQETDTIATGHYARTIKSNNQTYLLKASDESKDQSYFLSQLTVSQLQKSLFPIGAMKKTEVRAFAQKIGLPTYNRPDSQGLCFLGKINYHDFLEKHLGQKTGKIIDSDTKKIIGEHQGHWFFTIGQREGLKIGGLKTPYYICDKNPDENIVFVASGRNNSKLYKDSCSLVLLNYVSDKKIKAGDQYTAQIRYHSDFINTTVTKVEETRISLKFDQKVYAVSPGQIGVLYENEIVILSGVIE